MSLLKSSSRNLSKENDKIAMNVKMRNFSRKDAKSAKIIMIKMKSIHL